MLSSITPPHLKSCKTVAFKEIREQIPCYYTYAVSFLFHPGKEKVCAQRLSEYNPAHAPAGFVIRRFGGGLQIRREHPDMFCVHTRKKEKLHNRIVPRRVL